MQMLTVTQLNTRIKRILTSQRELSDLWLAGEISNFTRAFSGHCYFTLKDRKSAISCVMWKSQADRLNRLPVNGEQVTAHGSVSFYENRGQLQFYADSLESAGLGQLYQQFEALKARLAAEGLFDEARKRPIPAWPRRIGVVTSANAAALRDILRTITARYPLAEVLLAPAAVQGVEAPPQIVAAIKLLNDWTLVEPVDVIIVARGGGSIEELWAFNDEQVARAIAASQLPVISGVGHETDFTLADFVADLRAPTPTGAAAQATPDRLDLQAQLHGLRGQALKAIGGRLQFERQALAQSQKALRRNSPQVQIANRRQQLDDLNLAANRTMTHRLELARLRLAEWQARLNSLDPRAVLARGYAIVHSEDGAQVVTSVTQVRPGQRLRVTVGDGEFESMVS